MQASRDYFCAAALRLKTKSKIIAPLSSRTSSSCKLSRLVERLQCYRVSLVSMEGSLQGLALLVFST